MLIRWAAVEDIPGWLELAEEVAPLFDALDMAKDPEFHAFMQRKLSRCEALIAADRRTNRCLGIISFSRANNHISWFAVSEKSRGKGIGAKLLKCALRQLNRGEEIALETYRDGVETGVPARRLFSKFDFREADNTLFDNLGNPRSKMVLSPKPDECGGSFHYQFPQYAKWADIDNCPVCQDQASDYPPVLIKELEHSWVECYEEAQGRLFGKCHVLSKKHSVHFYDLPTIDMANFMSDVQRAAKALHTVTGAIKINFEIHGNSMPHLHVHLFPRYLDDDFPGAPIDYRITEPLPYEDKEEFHWFVAKMRELLTT